MTTIQIEFMREAIKKYSYLKSNTQKFRHESSDQVSISKRLAGYHYWSS